MNKLWVLPLEPLEMRYTKQWHDWFRKLLQEKKINHEFITGGAISTDEIQIGEVLDVYRTNIWKLHQIETVILYMQNGMIQNGDKIFTFDMWHTGLEAIQYVKSMTGLKVDVYGIWHAGSYDHSDFTYRHGFEPWAFNLERMWAGMAKKMFVGSTYHQKMIKDMRGIDTIVTGLPINIYEIRKIAGYQPKKKQVIFTGRLDPEKRLDIAKKIQTEVRKIDPAIEFIYTQEHNFSKEQYYKILASSKFVLSTAEHENFGIGILEGMSLDCIPIVPDGLSYVDYVPQEFRYRYWRDAVKLIVENVHTSGGHMSVIALKYQHSFDNMLREMGY